MFRKRRREAPRPTPRQALALACAALAGWLGLLPSAAGAGDPLALLTWLALLAPAAGFLVGACGLALFPYAFGVPGAWAFALVSAQTLSARDLPSPFWSLLALWGFFAAGVGLGNARARQACAGAGLLLLALLFLSGLPVQGGLAGEGTGEARSWARHHPHLAALFVELSPTGFVLDCAGWDWTHSHPDVYALSGVEWFPRRPRRAPLAAVTALVVGCSLGVLLGWRARRVDRVRLRSTTL